MSLAPDGPTSTRTVAAVALNAICPYFTMFPLSVPTQYLADLAPGAWVLDPFCGRGTTNYAARLLGFPSVGVDGNPVAVAVAAGKMADCTASMVQETCAGILEEGEPAEPPVGDFWALGFHPDTLQALATLRQALMTDCVSPARRMLRALLLGALHGPRNKGLPSYFSNQMPRTYASKPAYAVRFWQKNDLVPSFVDVLDLVRRKAAYYLRERPDPVESDFYRGDSAVFDFRSTGRRFSRVITSPPYYGMRTYVPDQWLRNWLVGGPPTVVYRAETQMSHGSPAEFARQLASTWDGVARACTHDARFMVRFGGIHDRTVHPRDVMDLSLQLATCGLRIESVQSAGDSRGGKRQAKQFSRPLRNPIEEFDYHLVLEGA